jgi:hypothetical protein
MQTAASPRDTFRRTDAAADCAAQLAQVQTRIAEALRDRTEAQRFSASTRRMVEQRLHGLYVLEWEIKQDLARCTADAA